MEIPAPDSLPLILCVDDEVSILKSMQRLLTSKDVRLLLASSGAEALQLMQQHRVHLIISDMRMPQMTGAEFLAQAAKIQPDCYRILLTGYADLASTVEAINLGRIHRYIQKPWQNAELLQQIDDGLEHFRLIRANKQLTATVARQLLELKKLNSSLEEKVTARTAQLKAALDKLQQLLSQQQRSHHETFQVLYNLLSSTEHISGEFALNVAQTSANLARQLGLDKGLRQQIRQAGLFSEIGKLALPAAILQQPVYKLNVQDKTLYLQHPHYAEDMLTPAPHLHPVRDFIAAQYEKFAPTADQARCGTDIPIGARVLAVARDYWLYRMGQLGPQPLGSQQANDMIYRQQGTLYDPAVTIALNSVLANGELKDEPIASTGLAVDELQPGMVLKHNLYNKKKLMLVPKGHQFSVESIASLQRYQQKHQEMLQVPVELATDLQLEEEQ